MENNFSLRIVAAASLFAATSLINASDIEETQMQSIVSNPLTAARRYKHTRKSGGAEIEIEPTELDIRKEERFLMNAGIIPRVRRRRMTEQEIIALIPGRDLTPAEAHKLRRERRAARILAAIDARQRAKQNIFKPREMQVEVVKYRLFKVVYTTSDPEVIKHLQENQIIDRMFKKILG